MGSLLVQIYFFIESNASPVELEICLIIVITERHFVQHRYATMALGLVIG